MEPRPHFYSVTPTWVQSVLRAGACSPVARDLQLPLHTHAFSALLPLLLHGATDAGGVKALTDGRLSRLGEMFVQPKVKKFVADARILAEDPTLAIRDRGVYLRTENPLTAQFIPPRADGVARALEAALTSIRTALVRCRGEFAKSAICAVLGEQILLTIHPFRDGNGRTARMFFAAQLLRHVGPAPTGLLGMLLMHRAGGHQYHQASWALRAGNVEPMVDLFVSSENLAYERMFRGSAWMLSQAEFQEQCLSDLHKLC